MNTSKGNGLLCMWVNLTKCEGSRAVMWIQVKGMVCCVCG